MSRKHFVCLTAAFLLASWSAGAKPPRANRTLDDLPTFKQEVVASRGAIATNHPLASAAGQMMLAKGGNAIDAIVAAYFALSVVEPSMSSPFGSGFINIYTAEGEAITLDNYTVAPGEATPDMYRLEHPEDEKTQAEAGHVVGYVRDNGGILSMDDMAWYYGDGLGDLSDQQGLRLRRPVRGTYRGYEIIAMPPTSSGGTHIVEMLNILEGFELGQLGFATPET